MSQLLVRSGFEVSVNSLSSRNGTRAWGSSRRGWSAEKCFYLDLSRWATVRTLSQVVPDLGNEATIISVSCGLKPLWKLRTHCRVLSSYQHPWYLKSFVPLNECWREFHGVELTLCIITTSFSVQVNGELAWYFQSSRDIRQGCFFITVSICYKHGRTLKIIG